MALGAVSCDSIKDNGMSVYKCLHDVCFGLFDDCKPGNPAIG